MNILKRHKLLIIILISIIIPLFYMKDTYAATRTYNKSIVGYAYDEENVGIPGIEVSLCNEEEGEIEKTITDENGMYKFTPAPGIYNSVVFTWGSVDEDMINDIRNEDDVKEIQNIIKYNGQDYSSSVYGNGEKNVQISLVIDCSDYVEEAELNRETELIRTVVSYLLEDKILGETTNVEINLISYSDNAKIECEFTKDPEEMYSKIDSIEKGGANNTLQGLETAINNDSFRAENRFIMFLSAGADNDNSDERIDKIKSCVDLAISSGINIYSLYLGDDAVPENYEKYFKNAESFDITDIADMEEEVYDLIDNLNAQVVNYIQKKLDYSAVMEDGARRGEVDDYFKTISYKNTACFKAIDIAPNIALEHRDEFQEYVRTLSENVSMSGVNRGFYIINSRRNLMDRARTIEGPTLKLYKRPDVSFKEILSVTGMKITGSDGGVISEKKGELKQTLPLIATEETQALYGATLELEYGLAVQNNFNIVNNGINEIVFFAYLPQGFLLSDNNSGTVNNNRAEVTKLQVTKENILDERITSYFGDEEEESINKLKTTKLYDEIVNDNKNAILIIVKYDDESFKYNEVFTLNFTVSKLLTGEEDETYQEKVEILSYSNSNDDVSSGEVCNRRIQGVALGNGVKGEIDTVEFSNLAIIIPPTGGDKRKIGIYVVIVILVIIQIIIISILKKKSKK